MIDTHAHIYLDQYDDLPEVMERCRENGVTKVLMPNIDSGTIESMFSVEKEYGNTHPMMGLHPCSVNESFENELKIVADWFEKRDFIAVGEIGIDLYWDKSFKDQQIEAFRFQLQIAKRKRIPAVIHCRESLDLTIGILEEIADPEIFGVFHCFTGSIEQGRRIIDLGFSLGIGGVATFKNGGMDRVLPDLPLESMVLETDSPYLSPVPYRGKRNEPAYLSNIATRIAELKNTSLSYVDLITTRNAQSLFKL
jgi:TatD DNase family protein